MTRSTRNLVLAVALGVFTSFALLASVVQGSASKASTAIMSMSGCLQKGVEPGGFYVVGEGDKMWELSSRTVKLAEHVGQQVTVTGTSFMKSKTAEAKSADNEKAEASGKTYADLNVKSLTVVSQTCSR